MSVTRSNTRTNYKLCKVKTVCSVNINCYLSIQNDDSVKLCFLKRYKKFTLLLYSETSHWQNLLNSSRPIACKPIVLHFKFLENALKVGKCDDTGFAQKLIDKCLDNFGKGCTSLAFLQEFYTRVHGV